MTILLSAKRQQSTPTSFPDRSQIVRKQALPAPPKTDAPADRVQTLETREERGPRSWNEKGELL